MLPVVDSTVRDVDRARERLARTVDDGVATDRIRSRLGPVVKRLDEPHVQVTAYHGLVWLHGCVSNLASERQIVRSVAAMPGVAHIHSRLHIGLGPGDSRPSSGTRGRDSHRPSGSDTAT